jgi:hypothetical protein
VDLIFNHITIETEYGKCIKIALPVDNDYCLIDKEEFEKIIDELIKIPN